MNKFSKIAMAVVLATMGGAALAANTVTLEVKGKITPTGCSVSLSGTENLAFNIHTSQLLDDGFYKASAKEFTMAIHCAGDTKMYWTVADNKAGSKPEGIKGEFGLGTFGTTKIGSYHIIRKLGKQTITTADGKTVAGVRSAFKEGGAPTGNDFIGWDGDLHIKPGNDSQGYTTGSGINQTVVAAQNYTETLTVEPYFNKKSAFNEIAQEADIAGSATIIVTQL